MPEHIVVLCTCPSQGEAERIANALVSQSLAACVSIAPPVQSIYRWQGKIESASEWLLIAKTRASRFDEVASVVRTLHSYEVPEIIALPVAAGSSSYLQWIDSHVDQ